jgi:hypothetical protein
MKRGSYQKVRREVTLMGHLENKSGSYWPVILIEKVLQNYPIINELIASEMGNLESEVLATESLTTFCHGVVSDPFV